MLFAVHISERILTTPWCVGGFLLAGVLLWLATWRLRDEEIPRIALLTAALFISSSIRIPLGPTSVHLLLGGLTGVVLGLRAPLAIAVGLVLQAFLLQHGGLTTLGVNIGILSVPALLTGWIFHGLMQLPGLHRPFLQFGLVWLSIALWIFSVQVCLAYLIHPFDSASLFDSENWLFVHPLAMLLNLTLSATLTVWLGLRHGRAVFPLGLLIGIISVLLSVLFNGTALILGGEEVSQFAIGLVILAHMPVAAIEGLILGFVLEFLRRVKPELLRGEAKMSEDAITAAGPEKPHPAILPTVPAQD